MTIAIMRWYFIMDQAVHNAALCVKRRYQLVKKPAILMLIFSPGRKGDEVSELHQARCARVYKERNLGKITEPSPGSALNTISTCMTLQWLFVFAFIHNKQPALTAI